MPSPSIVVLDGYTLNPGDLDWTGLEELGTCRVYERTAPAEVVQRAAPAEIVLTNKVVLDAGVLGQLPRLRYIGVLATGTNVVDLATARGRGVPVTNVPAYSTESVAQTVFALLLELTHRAGHHSRTVSEGRWSRNPDFSYWDYPLTELAGLTFGVVGFGRIGAAVARIASAFQMTVLAFSPSGKPLPGFVERVSLEDLFRRSDVVSLHCPLTPETRHMVNRGTLSRMKPTAWLLNTGRGDLVEEAALAEALNAGRIAGAGLDVLSKEPPPPDNPLLTARNCVITPHFAWASFAARKRLMRVATENVRAFLDGRPQNVVN